MWALFSDCLTKKIRLNFQGGFLYECWHWTQIAFFFACLFPSHGIWCQSRAAPLTWDDECGERRIGGKSRKWKSDLRQRMLRARSPSNHNLKRLTFEHAKVRNFHWNQIYSTPSRDRLGIQTPLEQRVKNSDFHSFLRPFSPISDEKSTSCNLLNKSFAFGSYPSHPTASLTPLCPHQPGKFVCPCCPKRKSQRKFKIKADSWRCCSLHSLSLVLPFWTMIHRD